MLNVFFLHVLVESNVYQVGSHGIKLEQIGLEKHTHDKHDLVLKKMAYF